MFVFVSDDENAEAAVALSHEEGNTATQVMFVRLFISLLNCFRRVLFQISRS